MLVPQNEQAYRSVFKVDTRKRQRRGGAFLWELRQTLTWTWIAPLLVIAGSFVFSWLSYMTALHELAPPVDGLHPRIKIVLDYTDPLRTTLELLLPIVSVFLATDILLKEWRRGTLAMLATRRSLLWFFTVRFGYLLSYVLVITVGGLLLSWWFTPVPQTDLSMGVWFWQALLTVMAPTVLLMALGLLVAHLAVNTIASYIVPACGWLANWLFALQVEQGHSTSAVLSYLLFGWSDKNLTPDPDAWLAGKVWLYVLALLLLAVQPWLLQRVALQHKDAE